MALTPVFARRVFLGAAIYGFVVLTPMYFLEAQVSHDLPPAVTHPEQYYGFVGVALVWQLVFWMIARNLARYRPLMPVAMLEKLAFGGATVVLFVQGRIATSVLAVGLIELLLMVLFFLSYRATSSLAAASS